MPQSDYAREQELIRRGPHEYLAINGGVYKAKPYVHQEYPKMMLRTPRPQFKEFRKKLLAEQAGDSQLHQLLLGQKLDMQALYDAAVREWGEEAQASIVKNKAEEEAWLEANPQEEPKVLVTPSVKARAQELKSKRTAQVEALASGQEITWSNPEGRKR
jgi:hypothetical protein